jgi:steroid delta-isomerase-like uncharacterized protein
MEIVTELVDAWNARRLDDFVRLLAEDVEWYDPAMPEPPVRGRAAVQAFAAAVLEAFPDFKYEVQPPACYSSDGSRCAIVWRIAASHLHKLQPLGYAPTNRSASIEGVDVLDIRNGQVARILTAFDIISAAEQLLGMKLRPSPGTWRGRIAVAAQQMLAWVKRK